MNPLIESALRCPIDPTRQAKLNVHGDHVVCLGCRVVFPVRDGLPVLVPGEARLPESCQSLDELPCRRAATR